MIPFDEPVAPANGGRVIASPAIIPGSAKPFDYSALDGWLADEARAAAVRIRNRIQVSIIETGKDLIAIKAKMPYGTFGSWITAEFSMSERTAQNYMGAARFVEGKSATVALLPPPALYALAAPNAAPEIVKQVVADVEAGIPVTTTMIRDRLNGAQAVAQRAADATRVAELSMKQREAGKRRQAEREEYERKSKEENEAREVRVLEATRFLLSKLGISGVLELLLLLGDAGMSRIEGMFNTDGWPKRTLTVAEIEEKFGAPHEQ